MSVVSRQRQHKMTGACGCMCSACKSVGLDESKKYGQVVDGKAAVLRNQSQMRIEIDYTRREEGGEVRRHEAHAGKADHLCTNKVVQRRASEKPPQLLALCLQLTALGSANVVKWLLGDAFGSCDSSARGFGSVTFRHDRFNCQFWSVLLAGEALGAGGLSLFSGVIKALDHWHDEILAHWMP